MSNATPSKQFSFRLPPALVGRVEQCVKTTKARGLDLNRADVVRLLLTYALNATKCRVDLLLGTTPARRRRA